MEVVILKGTSITDHDMQSCAEVVDIVHKKVECQDFTKPALVTSLPS